MGNRQGCGQGCGRVCVEGCAFGCDKFCITDCGVIFVISREMSLYGSDRGLCVSSGCVVCLYV